MSENTLPRKWLHKTVGLWAHSTEFIFSAAETKLLTPGFYEPPEDAHAVCVVMTL